MHLLGIAALAAAIAAGCSNSSESSGKPAEAPAEPEPAAEPAKPAVPASAPIGAAIGDAAPAAGTAIKTVPFELNDAIDEDMPIKGKVIAGQRWTDANGDNMLVQSLLENMADDGRTSLYLFANHFVRSKDGKVTQLREVKDKYEDCEFDNMTRFLEDVSEVTDLDGDGIGEVWFAYVADCTSDVSPLTTKLLGLESGDKYIIRGTIDAIGGSPGDKNVDPSLTRGPKEFAAHADQLWAKLARVE